MPLYAVLIYVFLYAPIALIVVLLLQFRALCHGLAGLLAAMVRQGLLAIR